MPQMLILEREPDRRLRLCVFCKKPLVQRLLVPGAGSACLHLLGSAPSCHLAGLRRRRALTSSHISSQWLLSSSLLPVLLTSTYTPSRLFCGFPQVRPLVALLGPAPHVLASFSEAQGSRDLGLPYCDGPAPGRRAPSCTADTPHSSWLLAFPPAGRPAGHPLPSILPGCVSPAGSVSTDSWCCCHIVSYMQPPGPLALTLLRFWRTEAPLD